MHARVVTCQARPGKLDEGIGIYRDSVVPVARQQKGFKGILLLTDPGAGKAISITLWETEADMKAGESSGYFQEQIAKFGALLAAPPVRETYEVSVQV
jgi:heme-degrading monooxygenase HmoA